MTNYIEFFKKNNCEILASYFAPTFLEAACMKISDSISQRYLLALAACEGKYIIVEGWILKMRAK